MKDTFFYIGHETTFSKDILQDGFKVSSQTTNVGQGSRNRKTTKNPNIFLNYKKDVTEDYNQVDAIYFRVFKNFKDISPLYGGNAIILLKPNFLKNIKWHFNTTENFGFYLNKISPFSGDFGKTLFNLNDIKKFNFDYTSAELVVLENLPKESICKVIYF